eukprot:CAMPEP_0174830900 /NCGR_PEP_ID=MMETSP1114-20130205/2795_1 /TAXON_ID=312471 /ORGANISM="Neobodo designis, Strain CCAP 1951/1" /LENGTH=82 /DNA_ID=CAMNT_0016064713 /DNA_START=30 /DNA_END=279 /DNA_ORIENTATION=-
MSGAASREHLQKLSTRAYLDETVTPLMMQALAAVARERPEDPVDFVAHYLIATTPAASATPTVGTATDARHRHRGALRRSHL